MRFTPKACPTVIKEEKEARLKAFVARHLETLQRTGIAPGEIAYRLLARSAESPAARALAELAPELTAAGVAVEAVLVRRPSIESVATLAFAECRFVTDIRLLDAHEQLVLDAATAWVGDCMRRDPTRRDTFELYSVCPVTARHAARSFVQIWRAADPTGRWTAEPRWPGPRQPSLFDPALIVGAEATPSPATLRH